MKLDNGIAVYSQRKNGLYEVQAIFRGTLEVVFQSYSKPDCLRYCHNNGMRLVPYEKYKNACNASFRKVNAKVPFCADLWKLGMVC